MQDPTDYTAAGFDKFLSRGDAQGLQGDLDQETTTTNRALPLDRTQAGGALGDTIRIGNIFLDGSTGRITMQDDSGNVSLLIGEDF